MGVSFSGLLIQEQAGTSDSGKGEGTREGGEKILTRDRGAWQATVPGVAKSWTQLSD